MVGSSLLEHWVMTKAKGILLSLFLAHLFGNVRCEVGECQLLMLCSINENGLTSNHGAAGTPKTIVVSNPGKISFYVLGGCHGRRMREKTTGFRGGEVWRGGSVGELVLL